MHAALIGERAMKWYKRDPNAALAGMAGLTLEECGAYNLVIDAYYARDGHLPDDDYLLSRILHCDQRSWRRLKLALFQKQKLTISGGTLVPNRGEDTLKEARSFVEVQAKRGAKRWKNGSEINETVEPLANMPTTSTSTTTTILESSLGKGREAPQASVVPAAPVNYRDPGNDYRSPPAQKSEPLTDEQRRARALLAAKTESTARKEPDHERQAPDDAESHADADAAPTATAKP